MTTTETDPKPSPPSRQYELVSLAQQILAWLLSDMHFKAPEQYVACQPLWLEQLQRAQDANRQLGQLIKTSLAGPTRDYSQSARFFVWAWDASDILMFDEGCQQATDKNGNVWTLETVAQDDWVELRRVNAQEEAELAGLRRYFKACEDVFGRQHWCADAVLDHFNEDGSLKGTGEWRGKAIHDWLLRWQSAQAAMNAIEFSGRIGDEAAGDGVGSCEN